MKVTKWVEFSQEVEIEVGADDIRCALADAFAGVNVRNVDEAFARVVRKIDYTPNRHDVSGALNSIGQFLNALTDEHIKLLSPGARSTVAAFLAKNADRFKILTLEGKGERTERGF